MKRWHGIGLLVLGTVSVLVTGCITPQQELARQYAICESIANRYDLGDSRASYIESCAHMRGYSAGYGQAQTITVRQDPFGPFGYWGPSWQEFNSAVQQHDRDHHLP